jgi:hypothetical protein
LKASISAINASFFFIALINCIKFSIENRVFTQLHGR